MEQKVFRLEQIQELKKLLHTIPSENIFLVRGKKSYFTSHAHQFIDNLIDDKKYTEFFDFESNPQFSDLEKGLNLFKSGKYNLIIAIGGGSVLDMAKLISVFAHQNTDLQQIVIGNKKLNDNKTLLLAIPTTAGTGAETTKFGVLYIDKKKYSVDYKTLLPDWVYLSSEFSANASPYLTACTGLDAFCQAVESLWSVNATPESEKYSLIAIDLIWKNLRVSVTEGTEISRQNMQEASYMAGKAINITRTTAPHALSYAFTSYFNIPHGHAVALSLPFFVNYNHNVSDKDCTDSRGANKVKERIEKFLELLNLPIENAEHDLTNFFDSIGINIRINSLIKNFDEKVIMDNINFERLGNNPRKVTKSIISKFLKSS